MRDRPSCLLMRSRLGVAAAVARPALYLMRLAAAAKLIAAVATRWSVAPVSVQQAGGRRSVEWHRPGGALDGRRLHSSRSRLIVPLGRCYSPALCAISLLILQRAA